MTQQTIYRLLPQLVLHIIMPFDERTVRSIEWHFFNNY
ncbi:hypothetical protein SEVCU012_1259 [Staphylococcus pettenkoferi VCU012]|nr:hypothetical protein SEVCU012_1259 [Staphylococcus pettenkoferi VCU012]